MKKLLVISLALITLILTPHSAFAAGSNCQPIYGGGITCPQGGKIGVDIKVERPDQKNKFEDKLEANGPKFAPDQAVNFKITVTNTQNKPLTGIQVQNIFPEFVKFAGQGNYNANTRTLTYTIDKLDPNKSKTDTIQAKIAPAPEIQQGSVCVVDQVVGTAGDNTGQDSVQFCISANNANGGGATAQTTKGGQPVYNPQPVTSTPATGPELLSLAALFPAGAAGLFLRKLTNKKLNK